MIKYDGTFADPIREYLVENGYVAYYDEEFGGWQTPKTAIGAAALADELGFDPEDVRGATNRTRDLVVIFRETRSDDAPGHVAGVYVDVDEADVPTETVLKHLTNDPLVNANVPAGYSFGY